MTSAQMPLELCGETQFSGKSQRGRIRSARGDTASAAGVPPQLAHAPQNPSLPSPSRAKKGGLEGTSSGLACTRYPVPVPTNSSWLGIRAGAPQRSSILSLSCWTFWQGHRQRSSIMSIAAGRFGWGTLFGEVTGKGPAS